MWTRFWTSMGTFVDFQLSGATQFTDQLSNAVVLDNLDPLRNAEDLAGGKLSASFLRPFLHESTHHAQFDSYVGSALAGLTTSCISDIVGTITGQEQPTHPILDLAKLRFATALLEPLIEGMALFCEHDAVPGGSPVASRMMQASLRLFSFGHWKERLMASTRTQGIQTPLALVGDLWAFHARTLRSARMQSEWIDGKVLLLTQSGRPEDDPAYLLGYLALKQIHQELTMSCAELQDSDLFLLAMVDYWFNDFAIAQALLSLPTRGENPFLSVGEDIQSISERFQDRFERLYREPKQIIGACLEHFRSRSLGQPLRHDFDQPETSPEYRSFDIRAYQHLYLLLGVRQTALINVAWPKLQNHRSDLRFSCSHVLIRVDDAGVATISEPHGGGRELLRVPAVPLSAKGEFLGSLEAVLLRDFETVAVVVAGGDGLVAVFDPVKSEWNTTGLVEQLDDWPSAVLVEGAMNACRERQYLRSGSTAERMVKDYSEQGREMADDLYAQLTFRSERSERTASLDALQSHGLLSVLEDEELLRKVAVISLACGPLPASLDELAKYINSTRADVLNTIDRANGLCEARMAGWKPFWKTDLAVWCRV